MLAVDNNGLVYVIDQGDDMIQIYDEYGGFIEDFVAPGVTPFVWGICFDIDNNLYIADEWNDVVHVFGP
jgi:hypothetical protein